MKVFVLISYNKTLPSNDGFSISNVIENTIDYFILKENLGKMKYIIVSSYKKGIINRKNFRYVNPGNIISYLIVLLTKTLLSKRLQRKYFYSIERINIQYTIALVIFIFKNISKKDIILYHGSSNSLLLFSMLFPGYKFIYYRHGGSISQWKKEDKDRILKLCKGRIIHVSNTTYAQIKKDYNNGIVINNGLNKESFKFYNQNRISIRKNIRATYSIKEDELVCFMGGAIWKPKGYHMALNALARYSRDSSVLMIAGDINNADQDYVKELLELSDERCRMIFLGKLNKKKLYETIVSSDIGMQLSIPSLVTEGISIILLEMIFLKLPVIVSNSGGNTEVITNHDNGFVVDENGMVKNIIEKLKLLESKTLRARISKMAGQRANEKFNSEVMAEKLYKYLIKQF